MKFNLVAPELAVHRQAELVFDLDAKRLEPNNYWFLRLPPPTISTKSAKKTVHDREHVTSEPIPQKRVRFAEQSTVQFVPHRRDFSQEEYASVWWTEREYKIIVHCYKKAVMKMNQRNASNASTKESAREDWGIECKTPSASSKRKRRKDEILRTVLRAQDFQRRESICDPGYIGEVSSECSKQCRNEAILRAEKDFEDTKRY
jgi:hypothetical protein